MDTALLDNIISAGGYVFSLLLGAVLFLVKRELSRHDAATKDLEKRHAESTKSFETKLKDVTQEFERRLAEAERTQQQKWDTHKDKSEELAEKRDAKRDKLIKDIQDVRTGWMNHCAEINERFLTKDEFVSSTTYLTKKTDEVSRLLQSLENVLARR